MRRPAPAGPGLRRPHARLLQFYSPLKYSFVSYSILTNPLS